MTTPEIPDVEMMLHPERWPKWPVLPLKNADGRLGALLEVEPGKGADPTVYLVNVYAPPRECKTEPFEGFFAVFEAGWRVD